MKEDYSDCMMLCFVQALDKENGKSEKRNVQQKQSFRRMLDKINKDDSGNYFTAKKSERRSVRIPSTNDGFLKRLPDVKRSFSDRFAMITDPVARRSKTTITALRKTRSTGNFASTGSGGGVVCGVSNGGGAIRSVPTTPLQLEPSSLRPRTPNNNSSSKLDRNAVKQLSSSQTSVVGALGGVSGAAESGDSETKTPSKARQKKFLRHFPQVGPDERVLNYYSCALVADILLQGHLYITKNYFAFYSNVFGYVTKLLIPTATVIRVEKERLARIIPNAVGVSTAAERYVFCSLLSRDATHRLMAHVVKGRTRETPELEPPPAEVVPEEVSEYSADSSSEAPQENEEQKECNSVIHQPTILLGAKASQPPANTNSGAKIVAILLAISAAILAVKVFYLPPTQGNFGGGVNEMYEALSAARKNVHATAARDLHRGLDAHLQLMAEVRKSLETLSTLIASDLDDLSSQNTPDIHHQSPRTEEVR